MIEAQGDIREITADIAYIINAIHTQFGQSEPALAEAFKTVFTELVTHPATPLWRPQGDMHGTLITMPKNKEDMEMFEINITVNCPDLVNAATILANAMGCNAQTDQPRVAASVAMDVSGTAQPVQYGSATPAAAPAPTSTNPVSKPTGGISAMTGSMASSYPSNAAPVTGVPLAQAPTFTLEQVSKAGADLITVQPAKMPELMGLLAQFGVQTVNALKPDQLGAFATALRGVGAQI